MRRFLFAAMAAALTAFTPAVAQAPGWQTYAYNDLGFSLDFPSPPTRNDSSVDTPKGPIPSGFVSATKGSEVFGITIGDYSTANGGAPTDADSTADNAMNGVVKNRTVLARSSFDVPGGGGRESVSTADGLMVRTRIYYVMPHIYIVMAAASASGSQDVLYSGDYATYFASFRMLEK
jgi:hypothetical protein